MSGNATAWIIFLISLLVLSLAATPYWRAADQLLIAVRLSLILAASVIFVRAKWRRRGDAAPRPTTPNPSYFASAVGTTASNSQNENGPVDREVCY